MNKTKLTFEEWLEEVDSIVFDQYGLGVDYGIDWPSADAYEDGLSPKQGARRWRKRQGGVYRIGIC